MRTRLSRLKVRRGGVLISAITFVLVSSMLVLGLLTASFSFFARCKTESDYEKALSLADAGVNYELRKLTLNTANADQATSTNPSGVTYTMPGGTFTVFCSNKDGSTPWVAPSPLYITSTGTVIGVSRTVQVSAKGNAWTGKFAVYTMDHLSTWKGSSVSVVGDVGTNNVLSFSGSPGISGSVYFNGPNAGWAGGIPQPGYTTVVNSTAETWSTVDEIALKKFPAGTYGSGGLVYLATNNDNASAVPPIIGNSITDNVTLVGPGNYYVTNISLAGQRKISFNNANGPVNLWIGPSGGTGTATFRGGTGAISALTDASKMNNIYVATSSGINMAGNETVDAVVYAYNRTSTGADYGYVQFSGNPTINGQVLGNEVDVNGNVTINYVQGVNKATNFAYWGFDDQWLELSAM